MAICLQSYLHKSLFTNEYRGTPLNTEVQCVNENMGEISLLKTTEMQSADLSCVCVAELGEGGEAAAFLAHCELTCSSMPPIQGVGVPALEIPSKIP